jgi:UDP-N-acetylmuramate--alanine ligase
MLSLDHIERIYFLGIGGIGMSALARYFAAKDYEVGGYDRNRSEICISLENTSCSISYDDTLTSIPNSFEQSENTLVVYTPAIPETNRLLKYFADKGFTLCKRAEILGAITRNNQCLAIAGTHGKTTISSMLAYVLSDNQVDCSAFLGGIATDFDSNLRIGSNDMAVVEADEFDRSFLQLSPNWALISSMDADHLDIYGTTKHLEESFQLFSDKVEDGNLIAKEGLNISSKYTYALDSDTADFSTINIRVEEGAYHFDVAYPKGICGNVITGLPGIHNVENALAAFAMAYFQGISPSGIVASIASFSGVKRRFEYHVKTDYQVYIDDYAHHPKEIEVAIRSARDLHPNKELTIVFQPHLFTRTRDFMDDFASALSAADKVMLLDIYPARELPIEGVNAQVLLEKITCKEKGLYSKSEFPDVIAETDVLMTLGAGDIDVLIEPIKKYLAL